MFNVRVATYSEIVKKDKDVGMKYGFWVAVPDGVVRQAQIWLQMDIDQLLEKNLVRNNQLTVAGMRCGELSQSRALLDCMKNRFTEAERAELYNHGVNTFFTLMGQGTYLWGQQVISDLMLCQFNVTELYYISQALTDILNHNIYSSHRSAGEYLEYVTRRYFDPLIAIGIIDDCTILRETKTVIIRSRYRRSMQFRLKELDILTLRNDIDYTIFDSYYVRPEPVDQELQSMTVIPHHLYLPSKYSKKTEQQLQEEAFEQAMKVIK